MKDYKKYFIIPEIPEIVYKALTNELVLSLWTGFPAEMKEEMRSENIKCTKTKVYNSTKYRTNPKSRLYAL